MTILMCSNEFGNGAFKCFPVAGKQFPCISAGWCKVNERVEMPPMVTDDDVTNTNWREFKPVLEPLQHLTYPLRRPGPCHVVVGARVQACSCRVWDSLRRSALVASRLRRYVANWPPAHAAVSLDPFNAASPTQFQGRTFRAPRQPAEEHCQKFTACRYGRFTAELLIDIAEPNEQSIQRLGVVCPRQWRWRQHPSGDQKPR